MTCVIVDPPAEVGVCVIVDSTADWELSVVGVCDVDEGVVDELDEKGVEEAVDDCDVDEGVDDEVDEKEKLLEEENVEESEEVIVELELDIVNCPLKTSFLGCLDQLFPAQCSHLLVGRKRRVSNYGKERRTGSSKVVIPRGTIGSNGHERA